MKLKTLMTPLTALMIPFLVDISRNIEGPKVLDNILRNPLSCYLISCFTVSLTPSSNTHGFSSDFIILIISCD